jgi:hypothetical protein
LRVFFFLDVPGFPKEYHFDWKVARLRPQQALLLARAVVKMKINVQHWRNDTDRGKPKYSESNLSQRHLVHHKSHTDFHVNINVRYT